MALEKDGDGSGGGVAVKRSEPAAFPFGFGAAAAPSSGAGPAAPPAFATAAARRAELGAHAPLVGQLQRELEDDVDDLINEEGWDHATAAGAQDWASDYGMVFRALRVSLPLWAVHALAAIARARTRCSLLAPRPLLSGWVEFERVVVYGGWLWCLGWRRKSPAILRPPARPAASAHHTTTGIRPIWSPLTITEKPLQYRQDPPLPARCAAAAR